MPESQAHGKIIENNIRREVFGLDPGTNHISKYDINCEENTITGKDISIKVTGNKNIDCGDIERFINSHGQMIVIAYYQTDENTKTIHKTYLFELNEKHTEKMAELDKQCISAYVGEVKSLPYGIIPKDQRYYKETKKCLETDYLKIHPKVDSKTQRRVQCSLNIEKMKSNLDYKEWDGAKIQLGDTEYIFTNTITSTLRVRNSSR
jgi:hypothetical protein